MYPIFMVKSVIPSFKRILNPEKFVYFELLF